ncbi:MAG: VOC family protein [Planctomycetes bacterium]|nr:VOC family protein [Planctomycetota bacterium]
MDQSIECVAAILPVRDLPTSLAFYTDLLGFRVDWQAHDSGVASVSRGRGSLMLCEGDQGHPGTWVWIGVHDVDALHTELVARGVVIRHGPDNFVWAREMQVADPDGNVLRFGSEPRAGEPDGTWLDMRGVRWIRGSDGRWTRDGAR